VASAVRAGGRTRVRSGPGASSLLVGLCGHGGRGATIGSRNVERWAKGPSRQRVNLCRWLDPPFSSPCCPLSAARCSRSRSPRRRRRTSPASVGSGAIGRIDRRRPLARYLELDSDWLLWIGDNVYADTRDDPSFIEACYAKLAARPEFPALRARFPFLVTWDDHDFGLNNAGRDYALKDESRAIFRRFWGSRSSSQPTAKVCTTRTSSRLGASDCR
jgi:hypothetical protein